MARPTGVILVIRPADDLDRGIVCPMTENQRQIYRFASPLSGPQAFPLPGPPTLSPGPLTPSP